LGIDILGRMFVFVVGKAKQSKAKQSKAKLREAWPGCEFHIGQGEGGGEEVVGLRRLSHSIAGSFPAA
jgi:hypothetical protein